MSEILVIQQGDSARIEIVLPIDKMAQVQDVVCTVGNRLSYSLSKNTLTPTATANVFHLDILSSQSQKHTGNLELVVAIDYSDIGVKKTKRAENLFVQVVRNENYFNNNSISELVSAVVIVTVDEEVVTGIPILASYLVINSGGGGGATNLGYTASPTNGIVTSDTGTDATIPLATTINAGLLSPSEKTAITHANRSTLDAITEAFTTTLKNAYDGAVTWITTNGANILAHLPRTDNPHNVTKTQVGLGNVDNTSDLLKPISTATQTALNAKQNKLTAGTNITIVGDTISASGGGGGGGISGSGASGQVAFWDGATSQAGDNTLLLNIADKNLELNCETTSAERGIIVNQFSTNAAGSVITFKKARGTIASPENANNGDLIGSFIFKARLAGAYTSDRSLFGSNVAGSGQGMFFCVSAINDNYIPALYLHPNRNVVIGTTNNIIDGITDSGFRLDVNGSVRLQGRLNLSGIPTSSAGLSTGDVWNDAGILKIV